MSLNKVLTATLLVQVVILGTLVFAPTQARTQPANAQLASDKYDGDCTGQETEGRCADKPFTHEDCQYPDRWTNPVDGCDNSDPAVPECIKSFSTKVGEDACIAAFVAANQTNPAQPSKAALCGGK